jgi:hypothetical protein
MSPSHETVRVRTKPHACVRPVPRAPPFRTAPLQLTVIEQPRSSISLAARSSFSTERACLNPRHTSAFNGKPWHFGQVASPPLMTFSGLGGKRRQGVGIENRDHSYECTQPPRFLESTEQCRVSAIGLPGRIGRATRQVRITTCVAPAYRAEALKVIKCARFAPRNRGGMQVKSCHAAL